MSLESYVTELMKNPDPQGIDRLFCAFLSGLEKIYLSQAEKKQRKAAASARSAGVPVISAGNITAGGTGKTPCILSLCEMLLADGYHPAVISRGYRSGMEKAGGIVSDGHSILAGQKEAGDEPFMMALKRPEVPILVGKDRFASAERAKKLGADILLLDDGFQYWTMKRDRDFVLIDCTNPFGYGRGLPRGLLREPMKALSRADLFILTKSDQADEDRKREIRKTLAQYAPGVPVISSCHSVDKVVPYEKWEQRIHEGADVKGKKALLLSGIGNPKAFEKTCMEAGLEPVGSLSFDDHHGYTAEDLHRAEALAADKGADLIVSTEKDAVKMLRLPQAKKLSVPLYILEITMTFPEGLSVLKKQWENL